MACSFESFTDFSHKVVNVNSQFFTPNKQFYSSDSTLTCFDFAYIPLIVPQSGSKIALFNASGLPFFSQ